MAKKTEKYSSSAEIRRRLALFRNPDRAVHTLRFFRTGPGEYGEGDVFWGVTVPQLRSVARQGLGLDVPELDALLCDGIHEVRACALAIMVEKSRVNAEAREALVQLYLRRTAQVNNWDLVDMSACLLGEWLLDRPRGLLDRLAGSSSLWEQRIAVVSTLTFIRRGDFSDIFRLAAGLLGHSHDLMHKALGWMLREVGKRDQAALEHFLSIHLREMPRTTLRYAIERFPEPERKAWLRR